MTLRVQDQSPKVKDMAESWPIVDDLLGGTAAMRAAGRTHLLQWPAEDGKSYQARLATATLFPAFRRTLSVMAGKPFSRQLTISEGVDADMQALIDDVDREGSSLHVFASRLMFEALAYGICGVLVENPRRPDGLANVLALERAAGIRPYLVVYRHNDILGWRSEKIGGKTRLKQLRLREVVSVDDGDWGEKEQERIRVLTPGAWQLYAETEKGEFALIDEGETVGMDEIPFVPFYGSKHGFMHGKSPLLDLAYLNVKHWQSQSDQDTILHTSRVPIMAGIGLDEDTKLSVGGSYAVIIPHGGDLKYVEHTGAAVDAGAQSLVDLEQEMIQTGAELLIKQPGTRTATESANDAEANKSELLAIVENFEDSLDQCLHLMAKWAGHKSAPSVSLYKDFGAASLSETSAQVITTLLAAGLISKATAIREQQRRGILSPDIVPEDEIERAAQDGPALGAIE